KIAPSGTTLWASAAMATATTTPTAAATAIPATVSAAIVTAVGAAAKILSGTVVTAAGRIVLRGIVMGREILRRGRIGIRLALLWRFRSEEHTSELQSRVDRVCRPLLVITNEC